MTNYKKRAMVLGATGLIGKRLVYALLEDDAFEQVHILVRNPLAIKHHKLMQHVLPIDSQWPNEAMCIDTFFCCIGTTIKDAGSQQAFKEVDLDLAVKWAKEAKKQGASSIHLVSAIGANINSSIFYNQIKGRVEEAYQNLEVEQLSIYRPSLLLGLRAKFRLGEWLAQKISRPLSWVMIGPLKEYKPIEGKNVALVMQHQAKSTEKGVFIISNKDMHELSIRHAW
jgi:uncharacterized protein YbjT (DUF2867 family)